MAQTNTASVTLIHCVKINNSRVKIVKKYEKVVLVSHAFCKKMYRVNKQLLIIGIFKKDCNYKRNILDFEATTSQQSGVQLSKYIWSLPVSVQTHENKLELNLTNYGMGWHPHPINYFSLFNLQWRSLYDYVSAQMPDSLSFDGSNQRQITTWCFGETWCCSPFILTWRDYTCRNIHVSCRCHGNCHDNIVMFINEKMCQLVCLMKCGIRAISLFYV